MSFSKYHLFLLRFSGAMARYGSIFNLFVWSPIFWLLILSTCILIHQRRTPINFTVANIDPKDHSGATKKLWFFRKSRWNLVSFNIEMKIFLTTIRCITDRFDLCFLSEPLTCICDHHFWSMFYELGWFGHTFSSDSSRSHSSEVASVWRS